MGNKPPITFREAGVNPALDEIPVKSGINLQGPLTGCLAAVFVIIAIVIGLAVFKPGQNNTAAVPTAAELPTETVTPTEPPTLTPDEWGLTGTARYLATHTPTPSVTPSPTETLSADSWAATGTALAVNGLEATEELTPEIVYVEITAESTGEATYTPYPTYTNQPPRIEQVQVTREIQVRVTQAVQVTRLVPQPPIIQTRIVPIVVTQPTFVFPTIAPTATKTINRTAMPTTTLNPELGATETAHYQMLLTDFYATFAPAMTETQIAQWTLQAPTATPTETEVIIPTVEEPPTIEPTLELPTVEPTIEPTIEQTVEVTQDVITESDQTLFPETTPQAAPIGFDNPLSDSGVE